MVPSSNKHQYDSYFLIAINIATVAVVHISLYGHTLCLTENPLGAAVITALCCLILYFIVSTLMRLVLTYNVNTIDIISGYFGRKGTVLCATIIGLTFFGWFMWQLDFCARFFTFAIPEHIHELKKLSYDLVLLAFTILFSGTALCGRVGLRAITSVLVPLLVLCIIGAIVFFPSELSTSRLVIKARPLSLPSLSLLLNGLAAHALSTPTFYRFSCSIQSAQKSIKVIYFLVLPIICGMGILLGIFCPNQNPFDLFANSKGMWWFFIAGYVILGAWTVSSMNLYYGADAIASVVPRRFEKAIVIISTIIAYFLLRSWQHEWMAVFEILITCVVGILAIILARSMFSRFILEQDTLQSQRDNCCALLIACFFGATSRINWISITGVPFFDTAIIAFSVCLYFARFHYQRIDDPKSIRYFKKTRHKD